MRPCPAGLATPAAANPAAAAPVLVLACLALAGCGAYLDRVPFQRLSDQVAWDEASGPAVPGMGPEAALPGVEIDGSLAGVIEHAQDGAADLRFEFRLRLAQPGLAPAARWAPVLGETWVEDDEGRQLPASAAFVAGPGGRHKGAPPGFRPARAAGTVTDYLVECRAPTRYRFQGIGRAVVHWTLQRGDGARVRVRSRFQN